MTIKKIGLLSPYNGSNLGDGAIQDAVIWNVRARYPEAHFIGITEWPERTRELHHIETFPLSASAAKSSVAVNKRRTAVKSTSVDSVRLSQRSFPMRRYIVSGLLQPLRILKNAVDRSVNLYGELVHSKHVYARLRNLDLLVVSGGGQLDETWGGPWSHPFTLFKWTMLAKFARTRVVILSVGACVLNSPLSRFFVKRSLAQATYRSFRDARSIEIVRRLGFDTGCHLVPDLAFSYPANLCPEKAMPDKPLVIGISPMVYRHPRVWCRKDAEFYNNYVRDLSLFVSKLLDNGYSIVFFTSANADKLAVNDIVENLASTDQAEAKDRLTVKTTETVDDLLDCLCTLDVVVASRLHGVILAHLVNRPVLAVSYDIKVDIHMRDMEQDDYHVDIAQIDVDMLMDKTMALANQASDIRATIKEKIAKFKLKTDAQYDRVVSSCIQ